MRIAFLILCGVQLLWFFGCIVTYRIAGRLLVEGMGVKSAEFGMFCAFALGIALYLVFPDIGIWVLRAVLTFWAVVQFFCHWYYTIFGASEKKLRGYNQCFRETIHLLPASETRVVPDLYHIVLHLLLLSNLLLSYFI